VPAIHKQKSKLHASLTHSDQASSHGGQLLVDAVCRRFDLWRKLDQIESLDPRVRKTSGFAPSALVAQLLFNLTSGGCSLADAERLGRDRVLMELVGLAKAADQTTLGEWLRAQSQSSVLRLQELNTAFVDWAWPQIRSGRLLHAGDTEYFFDDTEIEVYGKKIEGARYNYEGKLALSWQVLWKGPFVLDQQLDGASDVSEHLPALLAEHAWRWKQEKSYLYVDSASSAARYVNAIDQAGFTRWSISYNKWTEKLDKLAAELPETEWSPVTLAAPQETPLPIEQYAWLRHLPGECARAHVFAVVRRKEPGELFYRYGYVMCEPGQTKEPKAVFERHQLKGAKEQGFSQLLSDLDLHHPPCLELIANQAFYAIAVLAYNVLTSLRLLELPDDAQGWRVRTLIRHLLTVPVNVSRHARYYRAKICVPAGWLRWWRLFFDRWIPKRRPGRPMREEVDSAPSG
jgi:hypothetical protein